MHTVIRLAIMKQEGVAIMPAQWDESELQGLDADYPDMLEVYDTNPSKYNPRPGTKLCKQSMLRSSFDSSIDGIAR